MTLLLIFQGVAAAGTGTLVAQEGPDIAAFQGNLTAISSGTLVAAEGTDTAAFSGTVPFNYLGILSATEAADQASFTGVLGVRPVAQSPYPSIYDYGWYKGKPLYGRGRRGTG